MLEARHTLPPVRRSQLPLHALIAVTSIAAAAALVHAQVSVEAALVAGTAAALALPLMIRIAQRRFDVLEPIVTANVAMLVMFVFRPAALLAEGPIHVYKGYVITGQIRWALVLVLAGVVSLQIGYALPWAAHAARRLPAPPDRWDVDMTVLFALGLAALGLGLFGIFLIQAGGLHVLVVLMAGRSSAQLPFFQHSSAYFWGGPQLLWPASLLLFAMGITTRRRGFAAVSFVLMLPLALFAGGQGSRIVLLPLLMTPAVYYLLARDRRPRLPVLLIAGYLFFTLGIAYFRETRTAEAHVSKVAQLSRSLTDPGHEYRQLVFGGVDNDMFESLAAETVVVPSRLPISPLDFVYRTVAKPIPSMVWKGKPTPPEQELTHFMYPRETTRASSSSGLVGNFFQFGGLAGVIGGMLAVGWLFRLPWEYLRRFRHSSTAQLMLAACMMFIPILLRGAIGETLANALFGLGPLFVAARICQQRAGAAR